MIKCIILLYPFAHGADMFPSNGQSTALLLGWVKEWRTFMEADEQDIKDVEASESLRSRLFDPIRVSARASSTFSLNFLSSP